jgi:hypothetical protein
MLKKDFDLLFIDKSLNPEKLHEKVSIYILGNILVQYPESLYALAEDQTEGSKLLASQTLLSLRTYY